MSHDISNLESMPPGARVPLPAYAARCNRSMKTIERWSDDPSVEFPKIIYIRGRRYVTVKDCLEWEAKQPDLLASQKRLTGFAAGHGTRPREKAGAR
jgi:hypothetical protein